MKSTRGPGSWMVPGVPGMPAGQARTVQNPIDGNLLLGTITEVPLVVMVKAPEPAQLPTFGLKNRLTVVPKGFVITTSSGAPDGIKAPLVGFLIVIDCSMALAVALTRIIVRIACCSPDEIFVLGYGAENPNAV